MTQTPENETQTTPATGTIYETLGVGPVVLAAAATHQWLKPLDENISLENLAIELESLLTCADITNLNDPALMTCVQMRVLDTVFNQLIRQSMHYGPQYGPNGYVDLHKIGVALIAQRQCASTFGKLNHRRRAKTKE